MFMVDLEDAIGDREPDIVLYLLENLLFLRG